MEVQCPFQITFQRVKFDEFVDYFFNKFAKYGYNLAMIICSFETIQDWRDKNFFHCKCNGSDDMLVVRAKNFLIHRTSCVYWNIRKKELNFI